MRHSEPKQTKFILKNQTSTLQTNAAKQTNFIMKILAQVLYMEWSKINWI